MRGRGECAQDRARMKKSARGCCCVHQTANRIVAIGLLTAAAACPAHEIDDDAEAVLGARGRDGCTLRTHAGTIRRRRRVHRYGPRARACVCVDVLIVVRVCAFVCVRVLTRVTGRSRFRRLWAGPAPCQLQAAIPHHLVVGAAAAAAHPRRSSPLIANARGHPRRPSSPLVLRRARCAGRPA